MIHRHIFVTSVTVKSNFVIHANLKIVKANAQSILLLV